MSKRGLLTVLVGMGLVLAVKPVGAEVTTDIRVETNGEVKEFHVRGNEDVDYQAEDGSVKVKVNNEFTSTTTTEVETEIEKEIEIETEDDPAEATNSPEFKYQPGAQLEDAAAGGMGLIEKILSEWEAWSQAVKEKLSRLFG